MVWCGVMRCGVVWCGVVWFGVVWCGVVWCGVVWCGVSGWNKSFKLPAISIVDATWVLHGTLRVGLHWIHPHL